MKTSNKGIDLIRQFEGLRLKAYLDSVGVPTIGYGHTKGVKLGQTITEQQAIEFLKQDLADAELTVNRRVNVELTQNQFDALVSLVYNIGSGNFSKSSVLRFLNMENYSRAGLSFGLFNKGRVNGKLVVLKGLTNRRKMETDLFLS